MSLFPDGWQVAPLNEVCLEIVDCLNKTATVVEGPTPYKMIRTTNVKDGRVNLEETRFVDELVYRKWTRRFKPRRGDVILTREAPLGEVGLLRSDEHVFLGQRTMAYRANPKKLDQRFLYYSLLGPTLQAQIRMYGAGSTVEHMRVPQAESLLIPFPDLASQQKIAAILSAYDDLIANNQRRITLLERMAEDIYREWFVRLRFPSHEQVKIEKGVPQGWVIASIASLATYLNGYAFDPSEWFSDGIPIIKIKEMTSGVTADTPRNPGEAIQKRYHFDSGEIIFSWSATLLVKIWDQGKGLLNQHLFKVSPAESMPKSFLFFAIKFSLPTFEALTTGSTMKHIKRKELETVKVLRPPPPLLKQFDSITSPLLTQILDLKLANRNLTSTRDTLLPRLISGKLSVNGLDIRFPPDMTPLVQK